jgi:hypothetical protein
MIKSYNELSKAKKEVVANEMFMVLGKLVDVEASTYRFTDNQKRGIDFSKVVFVPVVEVENVDAPFTVPVTTEGEVDMLALLVG